MNRNSKTIKSTWRPEIDKIKGYIIDNKLGFSGNGYAFKKAISELKEKGFIIKYDRIKCSYINKGSNKNV